MYARIVPAIGSDFSDTAAFCGEAALILAGALPHKLAKELPPGAPIFFFPVVTFSATLFVGPPVVVKTFPTPSSLTTAVFVTGSFLTAGTGGIGCGGASTLEGLDSERLLTGTGGSAIELLVEIDAVFC